MNGKFQFDKTLESVKQNEGIRTALGNDHISRMYSSCITSMLKNLFKNIKNNKVTFKERICFQDVPMRG